ncbi:aminoglycoside phosphotransferase family protein [Bacillus benzoevorans]|uniref:Putative Ser/Thr protein kinase n=1 Tax=Bacillus benzoevorans TaxID=1456 RepID=A0A7X0LVJ5_9BACI|nr:aminoglycoside phosphotransferase family protein [Bacillus benzoevorans]MBB6445600.1 putative Ser/Thr protein kinase [Bacillus benzoevorans]
MLKDKLLEQIKEYIDDKQNLGHLNINRNTEVRFLAQGEYNINFTLDSSPNTYVFRVNTGSQMENENQIRYEYDSIKYLEPSGVTPKVFFVDDSLSFFPYGILIMEFLEGEPLRYERDLSKAAAIFSRIHSVDVQHDTHFKVEDRIFSDRIKEGERLLANIWDSPHVSSEVKTFFAQFLEWAKVNRSKEQYFIDEPWHVINNTEVNSHNFIIGKEKSYLIDWEKPVISDPAQDLTQFIAPTTTLWKTDYLLSEEEKDLFLRTYMEGLKGEDQNIRDRVQLYTPYLYLRALAWCAYAFVEYHDPNKQIKNMDTFAKIKSFLQIDFMKKLCSPFWHLS